MANRGKYIIGIRLLSEKEYLQADAGKDRCVGCGVLVQAVHEIRFLPYKETASFLKISAKRMRSRFCAYSTFTQTRNFVCFSEVSRYCTM